MWDSFPVSRKLNGSVSGEVSSFYIYEFPDFVKAIDLYGLFGYIGNVVKVSIAPRRNKVGKHFGFARFRKVKDSRLLAISLDNVQIRGRKIHVNEPRFERLAKSVIRRVDGWMAQGVRAESVDNYVGRNRNVQFKERRNQSGNWNRSFAEVFNNKRKKV